MDQRAIAVVVAAVAFLAGTFAAGDRTDQAVEDQAVVESDKRDVALEKVKGDSELVRFTLAYRACRLENVNRSNVRLDTLQDGNLAADALRPEARSLPKPIDSAKELRRIKITEPILDCTESALNPGGRPPELSKVEAVKYIQLVQNSRKPIVRNGKVVGSEEF